MQIGPLLVLPTLRTTVAASSNVLNRQEDKRGDIFVVFAPSVEARGESGPASYVMRAEAAVARFASEKLQNSEAFGFEANGKWAFGSNSSVFARVAFDRAVEPAGSAGSTLIDGGPSRYDQKEAQLAGRLDAGIIRITAAASVTERRYLDIKVANRIFVDQGFRDTDTVNVGVKAELALPNDAALFIDAKYSWNNNIHPLVIDGVPPSLCCDRSWNGGRFLGGISGEIMPTIKAEVAAGYEFRKFDAPIYADPGQIAWRARLDWYPTPLLSVALATNRSTINSGIPGVPETVAETYSVNFFFELRRNLNLKLSYARIDEKLTDFEIRAHSNEASAEARYVLGPRFSAGVFMRYRERKITGLLETFGVDAPGKNNRFEGGLWLRLSE